jgi:FG-GAP-like repeat/Immunoglobulin I-set domain/S-layer homology domain
MKNHLWIAVLVAFGAAPLLGVDCDSVFVASPLLPAADASREVGVADFNDDGKSDIVSFNADYPSFSVSIFLGNGDGTFQTAVSTVVSRADSMVVGDFNGDGKSDLVLAEAPSGGFTLLGNGDGTFEDPIPLPPDAPGWSLTAGYFDDDSNLDLAGDGVKVLLGNGDGTFGSPITYPAGEGYGPVAAGDIDGDGKVDIVIAGSPNLVSVLPGAGDGTFGAPWPTIVGQALSNLQVADVDGDGHADVVFIADEQIAVLFGFGDFTFEAARIYAAGPRTVGVAAADLEGGGVDLDLVATAVADEYFGSPGRVEVLRNLGNRAFGESLEYLFPSGPTPPKTGDFDGDGTADVVAGSYLASAVVAMSNLGDGSLAAPRLGSAGGSVYALADFNEDGILDLLGGGAGIALGNFDTTFSPGPSDPDFFVPSAPGVADFNGDGHLDVVGLVTGQFAHEFVFFAGHGDATFEPPLRVPIPGQNSSATGVAIADFDGDGKPDVAFSEGLAFSSTGQITVLSGDGQGGFQLTAAMAVNDSLFAGLVAADFDGDGFPDIASAGGGAFGGSDALLVFRGRGDGTFDLPLEQTLSSFSTSLSVGTFRQPDREDLVLRIGDQTVLMKDNGDLTFAAPELIAGVRAQASAVADIDDDGKPDLMLTDDQAQYFVRGLGSGTFAAPIGYPNAGYGSPILIGDVDGNQAPDVIVGGQIPDFSLLLNAHLGASVLPASAIVGSAAPLHARAGGFPPFTYQWRKGGVPLSDGGSISGSQTATLTIDPVSFDDAGSYDVIVTDDCGTVTSSPAILSVEFADVALVSPFHDDILAIATAGITGGCGGGNYCPTSPVRRDQMAAFLLKSEHGSAYTPPACIGVFSDVPCPGSFTDWVEQLAAEGVTGGCGTDIYCPSQSVTRAQMAIFLLKTKEGSAYTPPTATGIFGDVPVGSFGADFIEDLYNRGITGGCSVSPLLYCPSSSVLRQQMATFLVRTFFP